MLLELQSFHKLQSITRYNTKVSVFIHVLFKYRISSCISRKILMKFNIPNREGRLIDECSNIELQFRVSTRVIAMTACWSRLVQCDVYWTYRRMLGQRSHSDIEMTIINWNKTRIGWFLFFFSQNLEKLRQEMCPFKHVHAWWRRHGMPCRGNPFSASCLSSASQTQQGVWLPKQWNLIVLR